MQYGDYYNCFYCKKEFTEKERSCHTIFFYKSSFTNEPIIDTNFHICLECQEKVVKILADPMFLENHISIKDFKDQLELLFKEVRERNDLIKILIKTGESGMGGSR